MQSQKARSFSLLEPVVAAFVGLIIVSNIVAQKFLSFSFLGFPVATDMGTLLLFPVTYLFGDVLTEVFGFAVSRRVVWYGFAMNALAAIIFSVAVAMPYSPEFTTQREFAVVLGSVPALVLASLAGFWFGSFTNDFVMARMKVWMVTWDPTHRWLALRTIASTVAGELVDTFLFVIVGVFGHVFPKELWVPLVISQWAIKVAVEVVLTPFTVYLCRVMKKHEAKDIVGVDTYNPFAFRSAGGYNMWTGEKPEDPADC